MEERRKHSLSECEIKITALLIMDVSRPHMCDHLHITRNTLDEHFKRMYYFAQVHTEKEMVKWALTHDFSVNGFYKGINHLA